MPVECTEKGRQSAAAAASSCNVADCGSCNWQRSIVRNRALAVGRNLSSEPDVFEIKLGFKLKPI
jgi:hypothetical protein